jgi:hypothetical protein
MKKLFVIAWAMSVLVVGCNVEPETAKESTVTEVKQRVLTRIAGIEKAIEEGRNEGRAYEEELRRFFESVQQLEGALRLTEVGTEEQGLKMLEAIYQLAPHVGAPDDPPNHIAAGAEPMVQRTETLEEYLPILRDVINSMPDSDKRPPSKEERAKARRRNR